MAAQQILFARCVTGEEEVPTGVNAARMTLDLPYDTGMWRYGFWDASYMEVNGWEPGLYGVALGEGLTVDDETAWECVNQPEIRSLDPITPHYLSNDERLRPLIDLQMDSSHRQDPRFTTLIEARIRCIHNKGYETDNDELGSVIIPYDGTTDEQLQAALAEAQCSDDLDLTQQAGDLEATLQEQTIAADLETFLGIKQIADETVARARQILQEAGVL